MVFLNEIFISTGSSIKISYADTASIPFYVLCLYNLYLFKHSIEHIYHSVFRHCFYFVNYLLSNVIKLPLIFETVKL